MRHASSTSRHCSGGRRDLGDDPPVVARRREVVRRPGRGTRRRSGGSPRRSAPGGGASRRRVFLRFCCSASIVARRRSPARSRRRPAGRRPSRSTVAASIGRLSATIPPNAERSSHSSARWYAVGEVAGDRDAARVGVLDDRARRAVAEVVHELPRRVGVVEVEVREREAAVLLDAVPPARRARRCGSAPPAGAGSRRSAASRRCVRARARGAAGSSSSLPAATATIAASYAAVRANASSANARRVSSPTVPSLARSSSSSGSYWSGSVTIVTHAWFFAAARVIAGPPMSMVSMSGRSRNG